jgi:hypothetical protein
MSDPWAQFPNVEEDPWSSFPDADPGALAALQRTTPVGNAAKSRWPQVDMRLPSTLPWLAKQPTAYTNAPIDYPPANDGWKSKFGMFGRGPIEPSALPTQFRPTDRTDLNFEVSPYFSLQPDFTDPRLDPANLRLRPPTSRRAWTDDSGRTVFIDRGDGITEMRSGGTGAAWRDNDPGNMQPDDYTRRAGQVGVNTKCRSCRTGGFAILPDEQSGWNAMIDKLSNSADYAGPSIDRIVRKWVGPKDPGIQNYIDDVYRFTGWPEGFNYNQKNPQMVRTLARAIRRRDGWGPGVDGLFNTEAAGPPAPGFR